MYILPSHGGEMSRSETEYTLRWPPEIVRDEISRMIESAPLIDENTNWSEEVQLFLRQAFCSDTPANEFQKFVSEPLPNSEEEPF